MPFFTILFGRQPWNVSLGRLPETSATRKPCCCLLVQSRTSSNSAHGLHLRVSSATVQSKISPSSQASSVHSLAQPLPQSV